MAKRKQAKKRPATTRGDKSLEAFRDAVERSVNVPRDRLQEVFDDAVKRGRMTRGDANELVSRLVTRSREQTDELMKELERLMDQARKRAGSTVEPARKRAEEAVSRTTKRAREAAEPVLVEADRLRRRAGVGSSPISGYDGLTANQVKARLKGLKPAELRKVRTQEKAGKARKSVLAAIEKALD
ncbi:MAG: hypothetical protein M3383_03275 [Actinomycetota bacterium]|nr:hypothetical protein [Actinomycetota bacterium]